MSRFPLHVAAVVLLLQVSSLAAAPSSRPAPTTSKTILSAEPTRVTLGFHDASPEEVFRKIAERGNTVFQTHNLWSEPGVKDVLLSGDVQDQPFWESVLQV